MHRVRWATIRTLNCAGKPSLLITLAYLRAASRASASVLAPVHTILPELKMSAVVFGARIRIIAAAKRCEEDSEDFRVSTGRQSWTASLQEKVAPQRMHRLGFPHLRVVLHVTGMERDGFQVQLAV